MSAISHADFEDLSSTANECVNTNALDATRNLRIPFHIARNHLIVNAKPAWGTLSHLISRQSRATHFLGFPGHLQIHCAHGGIQHLRRRQREDSEELQDRGFRQDNRTPKLEA